MATSAIYGFEFTKPFSAGDLEFRPITQVYSEAKKLARDLRAYNMTGTVSSPNLTPQRLFHLEGVLSFIEKLEVLMSESEDALDAVDSPANYFELQLRAASRNNGGGAVIGSDYFSYSRDSRERFIHLVMQKLDDPASSNATRFTSLLFKSVETFRQRKPFLEISYFLLISGLEAFCRAHVSDFSTRNSSVPLSLALQSFGFNVFQDNPADLHRSISTYLHIRNALFHQGDFSATVNMNGSATELSCSEYLFSLQMLVSLTVMKAVGFDDGHTNWDCWIDRQLLK